MHRLVICEKDDAARRISDILSGGRFVQEKHGKVSVYRFDWDGVPSFSIGLRGHILNLDFPQNYRNWSATDPAELIETGPVKVVSEKGIAGVLRSLASDSDEIYVATDYDREGELIGMEALEHAMGRGSIEKAFRVRFSSLTREEVSSSFRNLMRIDQNLANAAEARQIIDLVWGAVLTRFVSIASGRVGHEFLSVGRVQSPTLAIIVDREREIKAFVPVPYWNIEADLDRVTTFTARHDDHDIHDKAIATEIFDRIKGSRKGLVIDVVRKQRTDRPPAPFNTTTLIKAANNLGLSAARIMSIAEDLYTRGLISYPRTDNTVYPATLDIRGIVDSLANGPYRDLAERILAKPEITPTRGDKETTDHPPIYPAEYQDPKGLTHDQEKVYDLIVRRFLATLLDPAIVNVTNMKIDIDSELFSASGIAVIDPGWRSAYHFSKVNESTLPKVSPGDELEVLEVRLLDKETKPPKRYSQGGLVQEMEKLGLGTKSTRHDIIQKLYDRRYIEDSPPRPTLSGEALINALEKHANTITRPEMTARLEKDMESIANGEQGRDIVVDESRDMLRTVMIALKEHRTDIGREISGALLVQNVVGKCPRCDNDLLIVRSSRGKRFVRCSKHPHCSRSYPLPQRGKVAFPGTRCELCRSPMMTLFSRKGPPRDICMNPNCKGGEIRIGDRKGKGSTDTDNG